MSTPKSNRQPAACIVGKNFVCIKSWKKTSSVAVICSCYQKSLHQSGFQRGYLYQGQIRQGDSYAKMFKVYCISWSDVKKIVDNKGKRVCLPFDSSSCLFPKN